MFGKLREKISGWFRRKPSEEEKVKEQPVEEKRRKKEVKKGGKKGAGRVKKPEDIEKKLKKKADKIKGEVPVEFDVAKQKYEPETEAIKEKAEEIREEALESEKEFEKDVTGERAEELEEELEEKEIEEAKEKEEPLGKEEVEVEIEEKRGFFGFLARKLTTSELNGEDFDSAFDDLEMTLLENNVAFGVVDAIKESLKKDLVGKRFSNKEVEGKILGALKNSIDKLLIEPPSLSDLIKAKKDGPFVVLFFGINGSGKTTSIAKLAWKLKKEGFDPVLAAGDTFRAASIEQLETHAQKIGVEIVKGDYGKDPASVAFDAISHAKKNHKKVVLIDTAGRMYTKQNLMKEMEKIVKVSKPDLKIFVGESITGNDAIEQARLFAETAGIDGIILSKADVDEKAGTILSVSFVTGKPIYFLGIGQGYGDLEVFSKKGVFKGLGLE
ncbi:MAG: signal recognition particle-docking protein FtsY [Nanoarchaeota archaeon]|nr:signal recognition particle-docking protein FtsY [Nanoarchaeota archaeon]MBU0977951.1 signal recognition particle-docking protein FtsY [Nanoarchaeota archaeon]